MTIQTETSKVVYECDGKTKVFPVSFYFFDKQIAVYKNAELTPLTEGVDYKVYNTENYYGGEVEFIETPAEGDKITITRNVEMKQLINFLEGESFPASDYEHALDKLTMGLQQLRDCISQAVMLPYNNSLSQEDVYRCIELLNTYSEQIKNIPEYVEWVKKISDTKLNITADSLVATHEFFAYPFRYNLALEGVTEKHYPSVVFSQTDALSGNFAPYVKTYNGGIYIYLKTQMDISTTIPLILLM